MPLLWENTRRGGEYDGSATQTISGQRSAAGARYKTPSSIGDVNDDVTTCCVV